jgi:hypothetical protein
MTRQLGYFSLR